MPAHHRATVSGKGIAMKRFGLWLMFCSVTAGFSAHAAAPVFKNCGAVQAFANCTAAICQRTDKPDTYTCACTVASGVPSGVSVPPGCAAPVAPMGKLIAVQSRYSPVNYVGLCPSQKLPWAQCLGVTCTVSADGKHASCPCSKTDAAQSGGGSYVIVLPDRQKYAGQCNNGVIYSSATYGSEVKDISQALNFDQPQVAWPTKKTPPDP